MGRPFREHDFLAWLREAAAPSPIGDDAAVVGPTDDPLLLALDTVVAGRHARAGPGCGPVLGRKAVLVNLSDIAAMGGRPEWALCGLKLAPEDDEESARRVMTALSEACRAHGLLLAGGDTVVGDGPLVITVTVVGRPFSRPVLRSGARPGDRLVVTGELGGSILGRHASFTPRLAEAELLVRHGPPTAMADVSDGLLRDLANIAEASACGAIVDASRVPVAPAAVHLSERSGRDPLDHALHDGEDFELLFTVAEADLARIEAAWNIPTRLTVIGEMVESGLWIREDDVRRPVEPGGFDHGEVRRRE